MYLYLQLLCIFVIVPNVALLYLNRKKIHLKSLGISLLILFLIAVTMGSTLRPNGTMDLLPR